MLKVGIIGVGNMGKHHARIFAEHPEVGEVYIFDRDKELAKEIANKHGIYYAMPRESITDFLSLELDLIVIATPTTTHARYLEEVLDNTNAYVLVEKPIVTHPVFLEYLE